MGILLGRLAKGTISFALNHYAAIIGILSLLAAFEYAPGPHEEVSNKSQAIGFEYSIAQL
jgi:hypothetical protein